MPPRSERRLQWRWKADYAAVLPVRDGQSPPLFVAALDGSDTWKLQRLEIGTARPESLVVDVLPPRLYRETTAALPEGVTTRSVDSKHDGILMGACDSWANGYFFLRDRWFSMALTD